MPVDLEADKACAEWYGDKAVPMKVRWAWFAGRAEARRPVPDNYLTIQEAARYLGVPRQILAAILRSPTRRKSTFPGAISLRSANRTYWYLPVVQVDALKIAREQRQPHQAVVNAIDAFWAKYNRAPSIRDISEHLGLSSSYVSYCLSCLRDRGIVTGEPRRGRVVRGTLRVVQRQSE